MIIKIQLTALLFLFVSFGVICLTKADKTARWFVALTLLAFFGSLAAALVTTLLRIWV